MKQIELGSNSVICQKWEESDLGWTRPHGFSLHLSFEGLKRYIDEYWSGMPDNTPDIYSRPDGSPYPLGVSDELYRELVIAEDIRFSDEFAAPGSAGIDGWLPMDR